MPEPRTLTVKEVVGRKDVPLAHGPFVEFRFHVEEFGDEVEWLRKGADPDVPSGQITGTVEQGEYGIKFKLAPKEVAYQAATQGGAGRLPAQPSNNQRTDATGRSIERQVSAKAAAEMLSSVQGIASAEAMGQAFSRLFDVVDGKVRGEA